MKTREFSIDREEFELEYGCELSQDSETEYLLDDLDIPSQYVKSLEIHNNFIDIKLSEGTLYFNDDWYVNLQRVG
ncbi:MAG: hypothetical protein U9P38_04390 [Campylobacterota bacterium]|nr:hypothetical protein [Campylobacterota bacterium]